MKKRVLLLLPLLLVMLAVAVPVRAGPLQNFYESPIPYWDNDSTSPVTLTWNSTVQTIIVEGGDASGNLDVAVPVERSSSQEIVISMDPSNLTSTVQFEFYSNDTASGQWARVNSSMVWFRDGTSGDLSGNLTLGFYILDDHNRFWISATNESGGIAYWSSWYGLGGNDWFKMMGTSLNGSLTIFFLNGDTRYVTFHNVPEWSESGTPDADVYQTIPLCYVEDGTVDINHDMAYTIEMPYFSYLRTEQAFDISASGAGDGASGSLGDGQGFDLEFTMWDADGNEDIYVKFHIESYDNTISSSIKVESNITVRTNGVDWGQQVAMGSNTIANNAGSEQHIGIWRNLDDTLGVMWSSSTYLYEFDYTGHSADVDNHATWMSEDAWTDWRNCSLTLSYDVYHEISGSFDFTEWCSYQFFEYDIYSGSGVAQPHFSSVWWSGTSGGQWSDYTPPFYSEEDAYTDENELPWWEVLGNTIIGGVLGIGEAIVNIGPAIADFLAGALLAIPMLGVALISGLIDLIIPGGGTTLFGTLTDIGAGITGIFALVPFLFDVFGMIIGHVTYWSNWLFTYILTPDNMVIIGMGLVALPMAIAAKNGPRAGGEFVVKYYGGAVALIFKAVYTICMGVINVISGFLPGT